MGQQNATGLKKIVGIYVSEYGNPSHVDISGLLQKLSIYLGKQKLVAKQFLAIHPLAISNPEAVLLANAFRYYNETQAAHFVNIRTKVGIDFEQLPSAAQTVITDFTYQYGFSSTDGNVRQIFWAYVNSGQWQELANWLKSKPDQYGQRREEEGERLQQAVDSGVLPKSGNPCKKD